ncbi:hypothetical protein GDO86_016236 [Hymenochirus boettgeri]|uniref:C2H2-type domain-containing protein n=1 Tax=Hymenochirus boettgeri TaxID=247094 RepID=A0A8T2K0H4_9PIPI|nr:hypothetical protein GDO86_016236 [Hymenochirus boettgeri]
MPRGFLVKRTRKVFGSYRIPRDDPVQHQPQAFPSILGDGDTSTKEPLQDVGWREKEQPLSVPSVMEGPCKVTDLAQVGKWTPLPPSPAQPVRMEGNKGSVISYPPSPAAGESFPLTVSLASMEKLLISPNPFLTPQGKLNISPRDTPGRSNKPTWKKQKVPRRLSFADEVTTSPVLGLKIKAEEPECRSRSPVAKRPPLGEFICQLCKEHYPDPLALAQHRCSRIVRIEYRCPECEKIFSCPANLASHRRWHKPRAVESDLQAGKKLGGKENSKVLLGPAESPVQHQQAVDSSPHIEQHLPHTNCSSHQGRVNAATHLSHGGDEEAFDCPNCHRRFRRHSSLRKHLLTHQPYSSMERGQLTFPCTLCGVHFPSVDIRDKHRLWHAVREELLIPLDGGQPVFPCDRSPTAFFSSPGIALHMGKCRATETRQDIPMSLSMGPGC